MWMSNDDIANGSLLRVAQGDADAAGVDGDAVIDNEAGKALRETGAAL